MPSIYRDWLYGILRHLLTALGGVLIAHGYASDSVLSPELISGLATVLAGVLLSASQKYRAKQTQMTAQIMPAGATEDAVQAKVAMGVNVPSVFTAPNSTPIGVRS